METVEKEVEKKAELAHKLSVIVHDLCKEVPHDIGLKLIEVVDRHFYGFTSHEVVGMSALCHMVREWSYGRRSSDDLRDWFRAFNEKDD